MWRFRRDPKVKDGGWWRRERFSPGDIAARRLASERREGAQTVREKRSRDGDGKLETGVEVKIKKKRRTDFDVLLTECGAVQTGTIQATVRKNDGQSGRDVHGEYERPGRAALRRPAEPFPRQPIGNVGAGEHGNVATALVKTPSTGRTAVDESGYRVTAVTGGPSGSTSPAKTILFSNVSDSIGFPIGINYYRNIVHVS